MINLDLLQKIKRLTISALVADDVLMGILVLKGGNALDLAYDISNRGSIDIDFSMEKDFTEEEKKRIGNQVSSLLKNEFIKEGLSVFDVKFYERPHKIEDSVKSFWGGYCLEFKTIPFETQKALGENVEELRKNAIEIATNHSTKFEVDISKYEYVGKKRPKDIEGATVYVYSPEMLVIEKVRALCQQVSEYKTVVLHMTAKSRARDFYDIYNLCQSFNIDFTSKENVELAKHIFEAKHVPLSYIKKLEDYREHHRHSWESVLGTISQKEHLKDFDFYFNFVLEKLKDLD